MTQVTLRAVREDDRARLLAWRNDPAVSAYMYTDHVITSAEHDRWFNGIEANTRAAYWVIEVDGAPVGVANLADIQREHQRCAWAYYLASPTVRGLGVGSYVEFWMIEHVFGDLGLEKLWCEVLLSNEAVWKLHMTYGFQREALFRRHVVRGGVPHDVVGLGLLASDWPALRPALADRLRAKGFPIP